MGSQKTKKKSDRISRKIIQVSNVKDSEFLLVERKDCLLMAMQFCVFLHSAEWQKSLWQKSITLCDRTQELAETMHYSTY